MTKYENKQQSAEEAIEMVQNLSGDQGAIVMIADGDNMKVVHINITATKGLNMLESYSDVLSEKFERAIRMDEENE